MGVIGWTDDEKKLWQDAQAAGRKTIEKVDSRLAAVHAQQVVREVADHLHELSAALGVLPVPATVKVLARMIAAAASAIVNTLDDE